MKRIFVGAVAGLAIGVVGILALDTAPAQSGQMGEIKQRIEVMKKGVLGNFKVIKGFAKEGKGSMADIEKAAMGIQAAAKQIPALFPKGTGRPDVDEKKTRALSKIWDDWATFIKANDAMSAHAGAVAMAASKNDAEGVKKAFGMMGKEGCGGCHKPFRGPKAK